MNHFAAALSICACFAVACHAQHCQQNWASVPFAGLPGFPYVWWGSTHFIAGRPTLFIAAGIEGMSDLSGPRIWQQQAWQQFPTAGIPASAMYGDVRALDDGAGEKLYWGTRVGYFRFDEPAWTPLPANFVPSGVQGLKSLDLGSGSRIFAKITYSTQLGWWNGSSWTVLGTAAGGTFADFTALPRAGGADLFAIGDFDSIDGADAIGLARWDGSQWHRVCSDPVLEGDGLKVITTFDAGSGRAIYTNSVPQLNQQTYPTQGLYRLDGNILTLVGATGTTGNFPTIGALQVFDDGRGPALYIGGGFPSIGGVPTRNLARWDGHHFEQVGAGIDNGVNKLGIVQDERGLGLWVQTDIIPTIAYAGGGVVNGLAVWFGCKEPACYVNCDLSTVAPALNVNDFMCFLNAYARRDPYADCTTDGVQNVADFQCFMNKFAAGCP